jgi:hypothetical protein
MIKLKSISLYIPFIVYIFFGLSLPKTSVRAEDSQSNWELVFTAPSPVTQIQALIEYKNNLYAGGMGPDQADGHLYRYDGNTWIDLNLSDRVGLRIDLLETMAVTNGLLFIGTRSWENDIDYAAVYSFDGSNFKLELALPGQGGFSGIEDLLVDGNTLYASKWFLE